MPEYSCTTTSTHRIYAPLAVDTACLPSGPRAASTFTQIDVDDVVSAVDGALAYGTLRKERSRTAGRRRTETDGDGRRRTETNGDGRTQPERESDELGREFRNKFRAFDKLLDCPLHASNSPSG